MPLSDEIIIITDANILINFLHIGQVSLLSRLPGYRVVLPEEVLNEITYDDQRRYIDAQIKAGNLHLERITSEDMDTFQLFSELDKTNRIGVGEAACLALAKTKSYLLASDDKKKPFLPKAIDLIGKEKILHTEDLIVMAIRSNLIKVSQADKCKVILEREGCSFAFMSFAELL